MIILIMMMIIAVITIIILITMMMTATMTMTMVNMSFTSPVFNILFRYNVLGKDNVSELITSQMSV